MIASGSGSPVGLMIVVSPEDRNENGMLTTCAIAPKVSEIRTMTPSAGQNRPRISVHDRAIAPRMVACSRMIAAGTSRSFVVSQSVSGMAARTARIVSGDGDRQGGDADGDDHRRDDRDEQRPRRA